LYFPFMHLGFMSIPSGYIRIERDYDFLYPSHVESRCPIISSPSVIKKFISTFCINLKYSSLPYNNPQKVIFHPFNTDKKLLSLNKTKTK